MTNKVLLTATGVRASGKTILLTRIKEWLNQQDIPAELSNEKETLLVDLSDKHPIKQLVYPTRK
jgi:molybdopterin-guanine dinucleotide biosynthesis protein